MNIEILRQAIAMINPDALAKYDKKISILNALKAKYEESCAKIEEEYTDATKTYNMLLEMGSLIADHYNNSKGEEEISNE